MGKSSFRLHLSMSIQTLCTKIMHKQQTPSLLKVIKYLYSPPRKNLLKYSKKAHLIVDWRLTFGFISKKRTICTLNQFYPWDLANTHKVANYKTRNLCSSQIASSLKVINKMRWIQEIRDKKFLNFIIE